MKNKDFVRLVIVLGALLVILLLFANPFKGSVSSTDTGDVLFPKLVAGEPSRIMVDGKNDLAFWQENGEWLIAGDTEGEIFPADTAGVNRALRATLLATDAEIISRNPEKSGIFEVDSTGIRVKILAADSTMLASFFIGKTGSDFSTNYVRLEGENEVYVVKGDIKRQFDRAWRGFRQMYILKVDKDEIATIELKREDGSLRIQAQDDDSWALIAPEEGTIKESFANRLLNTIANFRADDFAHADTMDTGLDEPFMEIKVILKDGTEQRVLMGALIAPKPEEEPSGKRYAAIEGSRWLYQVGKFRIETLSKPIDEMLEPPPALPDTTAAEVDTSMG